MTWTYILVYLSDNEPLWTRRCFPVVSQTHLMVEELWGDGIVISYILVPIYTKICKEGRLL